MKTTTRTTPCKLHESYCIQERNQVSPSCISNSIRLGIKHGYGCHSPLGQLRKVNIYPENIIFRGLNLVQYLAGRPGSSEVHRNPLRRWDVSSMANGIFLTKKQKKQKKMPNGWRTIKSLVHKIRLHGRRGKGMAESFSREKLRHAPQKEGG